MTPTRKTPIAVLAVILVASGLSTFQSAVFGQDFDAVKQRLLKSVEQDELSFEQAAAMMRALKEVGKEKQKRDRTDRGKKNVQGEQEQPAMRGLARIKQAVESGRITEAEANKRIAEMKKGLQDDRDNRARDRGARDRAPQDRDDARRRAGSAEKEIMQMIRDGKLTKEEGRARLQGLRNRSDGVRDDNRREIDRRRREADRRGEADRDRGARDRAPQDRDDARRRAGSAEKEIMQMIRDGKLTKEEGRARLQGIRNRADNARDADPRRGQDRDAGAQERIRNAEKKLKEMVEEGKVSEEEAKARLKELRQRIRRMQSDGARGEDRNRREAGDRERPNRGQSDRAPQRGPTDRARQRDSRDGDAPKSRNERRRPGGGESDRLSDREVDTIKREIEKAVIEGIRSGTESDDS